MRRLIRRTLPILLLTLTLSSSANPAEAHDCSSAADCERVVQGTGWLAALLALGLVGAAARRKPKWKTKKEKKEFKDCRAAVENLSTADLADADAQLTKTLGPVKTQRLADGNWAATREITWSLDASRSVMRMPEWSWTGMTAGDRAAVKDFTDALQVHETGHMEIATEFAESISGPKTAVGLTESEAIANLQRRLHDEALEAQPEFDRRRIEYDDVTEHGVKQSQGSGAGYPGGKNVYLQCP